MKIAPIIREMAQYPAEREQVLVHTGQRQRHLWGIFEGSDTSRAKVLFGFEAMTLFEVGLQRAITWYRSLGVARRS
jgi:nucleoside-diphosphate-sugar epimerase